MAKRIIAVDLDGTLARYDGWQGINHIGEPVPSVINAVKQAHEQGAEIHIFTSRVSCDDEKEEAALYISEWCSKHGLIFIRSITAIKHKYFTEFWDDRAIQVVKNTGEFIIQETIAWGSDLRLMDDSATFKMPSGKVDEIFKRMNDHQLSNEMLFTPAESNNPLDVQEGGNHYKKYPIQPIEFCHVNKIPSLESSVIKYVVRHKDKNGVEDLKKAKHIIDILMKLEYNA